MLIGAIAALAAVYALQTFTPLRLVVDSREYLVLAAQIADGGGIPLQASFPPGLPLLVAGLDVAGIAGPAAFVVLNLVFLGVGLTAAATILRRDVGYSSVGVAAVCVLTLLFFDMARSVAHPLTEVPYFGVSMLALAAASAARRRGSLALLGVATVLVVAACAIRTFGVALVPALIAALPSRRDRLVALPAVALLGGIAVAVIGPRRYFSEAHDIWGDRPLERAWEHVVDVVALIGEGSLNAPSTRVPDAMEVAYIVAGLLVLVPLCVGVWNLRRQAPVAAVYLAASGAVLLGWPLVASRFLTPLAPLLVVGTVEGLRILLPDRVRRLAVAWAVVFVVLGCVSLVGTTRISLSGDRFPERYGSAFRATYRTAWGRAEEADRRDVDERMLWVLRRYEPRALGDPAPTPPP